MPPRWRCQWRILVGVKPRVVNWKRVDVSGGLVVPESANCSLHATVEGALSETVVTRDGLTKYSA